MNDKSDSLVSAEDALRTVLKDVTAVGSEHLTLRDAGNRILSHDLKALRIQPPFDSSAMDGYAVRHDDIAALPLASHPLILRLVGEARAGVPFQGSLNAGEAVRIFTGAAVPDGADSIIIQENTATPDPSTVTILKGVEKGKFIRSAGLDFQTGETLLHRGECLSPSRLSLAASMNHAVIPVFMRPVVALIATGDELVPPGGETRAGQIIASNTVGLASAIQNLGADLIDLGIVADNQDLLADAIQQGLAKGADLIITSGGASVGDHDLVLPVARNCGFRFEVTKIAMRPGKPFLFGRNAGTHKTVYFTGLAGNPVSSHVAFNIFVKPLITSLSGSCAKQQERFPALLGCDLPPNDARADYLRAIVRSTKSGQHIAVPFPKQDSSMLANLVRANCLLFRPVHSPAAKKGDPCEIILIE